MQRKTSKVMGRIVKGCIVTSTALFLLIGCGTLGGGGKNDDAKLPGQGGFLGLNLGSKSSEPNPGPCPRAFALYDAARFIQFTDGVEKFANVGFTGQVTGARSLCRYLDASPIHSDLDVELEFGRGPAATGDSYTYPMFVAVTRNNIGVIEKLEFPVTVNFPAGVDRVSVTERIDEIIIPRGKATTSGSNFEIIIGFVVNEQQRDFNINGKRFRPSVGQ